MLLRNKRTILGFALMSLAAVMLTVPATAFARGDDRRDRSDYRSDDGRRGDRDDRADHREDDRDHRDARHTKRGQKYEKQTRHDHRHGRHGKHGHGPAFRPPGYDHRPAHSFRHAAAHRHASTYYCKPCNNRFKNRSGLHAHLSGHHHIPPWRLPFVVVHNTLGWVFFG